MKHARHEPSPPSPGRRRFLQAAAWGGLALALGPARAAARPWDGYARAVVIDGLGGPGGMGTRPGTPLTSAQVADLRDSGLSALHVTVGQVGTRPPLEAFESIVSEIAFWDAEIRAHPAVLAPIRRAQDIRAAAASGWTGLIYGLQDGVAFETDLSRLETLHALGVRVVQPTYNRRNLLGDGCLEPANAGLSLAGREAVGRMNALGILVDLSHCGRRTAADAIALSRAPVAFTHTGCEALQPHPRHRTDEELRAVAETGGVTGIYVMPYLAGGRQPTAGDVVRHLEHAIDVAGEDHVSVGTDGRVSPVELTEEYKAAFADSVRTRREQGIGAPGETEEGYLYAADLNTPRRLETLADLLLARGHTEARVEKILGRNLLRVFRDAWKPAAAQG